MCLTLCDPIDSSPPRLPCPWDSPGKNTGVGCHFLLQCRKVKIESEVAQSCPTLSHPMDYSLPGSSVHGIFQARALEWGAIAFSPLIPTEFISENPCQSKYYFRHFLNILIICEMIKGKVRKHTERY